MKKDLFTLLLLSFLCFFSTKTHASLFLNNVNNLFFEETHSILKNDNSHLAGEYSLFVNGKTYEMKIVVKCNKPKATIKFNGTKLSSTFSFKKNIINISINNDGILVRCIGKILNKAGAMSGSSIDSNGNQSNWSAAKIIIDNRSKRKSSKKNT